MGVGLATGPVLVTGFFKAGCPNIPRILFFLTVLVTGLATGVPTPVLVTPGELVAAGVGLAVLAGELVAAGEAVGEIVGEGLPTPVLVTPGELVTDGLGVGVG